MIPIEFNGTKITYNNKDAVLSVIRDLRSVKQNEKDILNAIIETEEKQRAHFASDLHDGLGPLLSTIKLYLQWLARPDVKADKKELLSKAEETLEQAYYSMKEISDNLSPHILQDFGLKKALLSFIDHLKFVCPITFDVSWTHVINISPEKEIAIYRILTECVNNSVKHSNAKNVSIIFNISLDMMYIVFRDDGKGFDSGNILFQASGKGFYNIRTRLKSIGGAINIESEPGKGVTLMFKVPL
jgi:signal transduction histidine kinase